MPCELLFLRNGNYEIQTHKFIRNPVIRDEKRLIFCLAFVILNLKNMYFHKTYWEESNKLFEVEYF